jgi:TonB-dependent receptor
MKNKFSRSLLASAIAAALAGPGIAIAGDITGKVTEAGSGRALPNATVRIAELNITTQSDRGGEYRFSNVPAGSYTVEASYVGLPATRNTIAVPESGPVVAALAMGGGAADGSDSEELQTIEVSGFRLAQITALQDKKSAKLIKESVTANDAGKLPDQNAAETLARVTGVSVTTDQGEGRYVNIRGIDAALNNVSIDGQTIGSPEGDTRRVALDTVPANLLAKLEVVKSVTPDLDGNAIGGSINIITPSAFDDTDGRFFSASADFGHYDLGGENPFGGSVAWGQVFGDQRFGIVLSASYSDREFTSENVQGGDPWEEEGDFLIPSEMNLRDYLIRRVRKGVVGNFEFRPNDNVKIYWRNIFNRYEDTELQRELTYDYRNGDLINQTSTSGTFTEGEGERANSRRFEIQEILSSSLGAEFTPGAWTIAASATYGETEQDTPQDNFWSFELGDEIPMSYDTSDYFWVVSAGPEFQDAANFEFNEHSRGGQIIEEQLRIGQLDFKRDVTFGDNAGFFKFGAKLISRESTSDQDLTVYDGFAGEEDLLLSQFAAPGDPNFYRSVRPYYPFGPTPDFNAAEQFFRDNEADFEVSDSDTIAESYGVDYEVAEDVTAGYVMASADIGNATFIGGVRVEQTETDFQAYDIVFVDGDAANPPPQVTGSKEYTNWMPGLQMTWAIQENLLLRAAWTNTIGRPSYEQNVPFRIFELEEGDPGEFEGEIEAGNSDLDPLESANYDLTLEWYTEAGGLLSAGVFMKDIENPIFNRVQDLEDVNFEGRFYTDLSVTQPQNAETGEIVGVELGFQHNFVNLPGWLSGFGVSMSYTWTDSEADIFDRDEPVQFFLQSDHVGNASVFWERAGFEMRLGYAYRSEYLFALGDDVSQDLYIDTHDQLDFKTSYDFNEQWTAFIQLQNLTDEPLRYFSGDRSRLAENEIYSWNVLAGFSVKF